MVSGPADAVNHNHQGSTASLGSDLNKRQPSQLAMAGSMNLLGGSLMEKATQKNVDDERLKKVMANMEKDKSL